MSLPTARLSRRWLAGAVALLPAGCASLLGLPPAPQLYRLSASKNFPANLPSLPTQILVDVPLAPAGIDSRSIALTLSAVSIDYFAASAWTARVPLLVQTALLESFQNSGAITAIERESAGLRADFILMTEIRHFEAIYDSPNAPPEVWVAILARLVDPAGRNILARAAFERRQRAAANDMPQIVLAFNEAAGPVMGEIVAWTVRNPALTPRRR